MNNKKTAKAITKRLAQQKRQRINKIIDNWKETKMINPLNNVSLNTNGQRNLRELKQLAKRLPDHITVDDKPNGRDRISVYHNGLYHSCHLTKNDAYVTAIREAYSRGQLNP